MDTYSRWAEDRELKRLKLALKREKLRRDIVTLRLTNALTDLNRLRAVMLTRLDVEPDLCIKMDYMTLDKHLYPRDGARS